MRKLHGLQKGFTLVELVVGMSLTLILLAALSNLLSSSLHLYQINSRRTEVQQTARIAVDAIVREFRMATRVTTVTDTSVVFTAHRLGEDKNTTIYLGEDDGILYIKVNNGAGQPITGKNNVILLKDNPIFSLTNNNHVLKIHLTAQYAGDSTIAETITTSVAGMNLAK